jgi:hypothetical protein
MKTSELTGAALDWAVSKCEKDQNFYSTNWAQGGPIVEREGITLTQYDDYPNWSATLYATDYNEHTHVTAPTPLIAAMRCYVASKMGDTVEIPEELNNLQRC